MHFIIIGFSFVTNRAYRAALWLVAATGLHQYDANSKILSTIFETLKFSKSDSNVMSSWRHQVSRFSVRSACFRRLWLFLKFSKSIFESLFLKYLTNCDVISSRYLSVHSKKWNFSTIFDYFWNLFLYPEQLFSSIWTSFWSSRVGIGLGSSIFKNFEKFRWRSYSSENIFGILRSEI